MVVCDRCGVESPGTFRFCGGCGAPLEAQAPVRETRKVVTALFCDVVGSTTLGEEIDPEALRAVMQRYFAEMRATIERHGGTVEKFIGDAVVALFGVPQIHEDDALRAVRAAAEIRERLPALAAEVGVVLRFRTGVNTGSVLASEGDTLTVGDAMNVAARLEQTAGEGEIVLGPETYQLVRHAVEAQPLEPLTLKGKSQPVAAFRLISLDAAAPVIARRHDTPFVGRERQLRRLRDGWSRAVEESGCHLFTLLGSAGVGKSRLVRELLGDIGEDATMLSGRCLYYGEGITFWPLIEALTPLGAHGQRVLDLLTAGGAASADELFLEVRLLLESLAAERPLILHIDDLQWAEAMLLDLIDHVADLSRGAPILILCTARPELLEERPAWAGGKLNATTVLLEPLGDEACAALVERLGDGLDEQARARAVAASQGNPLFLEEMIALAREGDSDSVPPTIQALLGARLERLATEDREVLECGAIEGEVFHGLAVRALVGAAASGEVEPRLAGLVRKELIRPHPATIGDDGAFRFRHLLIRDAAYDGLPKAVRADLHERFADWLEEFALDLAELDEIAAWHLEQAVRYRRELGREVEPALARRAAGRLETAGRRAGERSDVVAARSFLERAFALTGEAGEERARIAVELAATLIDAGSFVAVEDLLRIAESRPATAAVAALHRIVLQLHVDPDRALATVEATLPGLLDELAALDDQRALANARLVAFRSHWVRSRAQPAGVEALLAAESARAAGDERLRARALGEYVATLLFGPEPAQSMRAKLDAIAADSPGPLLAAFIGWARGEAARMAGDYDDAVALVEHSVEAMRAMGLDVLAAAAAQQLGSVYVAAGNPGGAVIALEQADAVLTGLGERSYRSTVQAQLARAHEACGERAAARAAVELAEELGSADDAINFAITHPVRARLALAEGNAQAAERWARSGVDYAFKTDFLSFRGQALLTLAQVLAASGRGGDATEAADKALAEFEAKGDQPGAGQANVLLAELGAASA
ncbi:MAG TPA: adenylate/guanylate cyclase domain-containing protein [Solirubrobacteraceae bacterium]|nr:adenylate/guanylate cyclase domain-containing protein [Solirubrobacteraceae bacterium]